LGAIVNRDLVRRIRVVHGVTAHKLVMQNDLRLAVCACVCYYISIFLKVRLCAIFDTRAQLYQSDSQDDARRRLPIELPPGAEVVCFMGVYICVLHMMGVFVMLRCVLVGRNEVVF
jgi:hypothetical protein